MSMASSPRHQLGAHNPPHPGCGLWRLWPSPCLVQAWHGPRTVLGLRGRTSRWRPPSPAKHGLAARMASPRLWALAAVAIAACGSCLAMASTYPGLEGPDVKMEASISGLARLGGYHGLGGLRAPSGPTIPLTQVVVPGGCVHPRMWFMPGKGLVLSWS